MNLTVVLFIVSVSIWCWEPSSCVRQAGARATYRQGSSQLTRSKRMTRIVRSTGEAFKAGIRAMKSLLKGARETFSSNLIRDFVKPGNFDDALRDFYKVRPYNVQSRFGSDGAKRIGEVGDRTIVLTRGKGRVTIEAFKRDDRSPIDRITYIK